MEGARPINYPSLISLGPSRRTCDLKHALTRWSGKEASHSIHGPIPSTFFHLATASKQRNRWLAYSMTQKCCAVSIEGGKISDFLQDFSTRLWCSRHDAVERKWVVMPGERGRHGGVEGNCVATVESRSKGDGSPWRRHGLLAASEGGSAPPGRLDEPSSTTPWLHKAGHRGNNPPHIIFEFFLLQLLVMFTWCAIFWFLVLSTSNWLCWMTNCVFGWCLCCPNFF
jgi:hypothetical protein